MKRFFSASDARTLASLAVPVFLAQLTLMSMGFVDAVVAGRAGTVDMAAVAVANSFWMPGNLFGQGLLMAITPLVAQTVGAGGKETGSFLRQGVWLSLLIAVFLMIALYGISMLVPEMDGMDPELARLTSGYLRAILWGLPGLMLYGAQRSFLDGHGKTRPAMLAGFVGLAVNIPLNFIFVFGLLGMPALGGIGCGVSSAIVCWVMCFAIHLSIRRIRPGSLYFERPAAPGIKRIARIGLPGAFALLVETAMFGIIAVVIAPLGPAIVAGHQVALNVSGIAFIMPVSLGAATTIRVGNCLGRGDLAGARMVHRTALCLALGLVILEVPALFFLRYPIARLYTGSAEVIALAAFLMAYVALYQIADVIQMVSMCALRGYNDTRAIFLIVLIIYWLVAFPVGYALSLTSWLLDPPMGVAGFWSSIVGSLVCAAALFWWRLTRLERLPLEAVQARLNR